MRFLQGTLHVEDALAKAFQTDNLVGEESVEHRQRDAIQPELGVNPSVARFRARPIGTFNRGHLVALAHEDAVDVVAAVSLWHIDELGTNVSHRVVLIDKLVDGHIGRDGEVVRSLDDVIVAIEHTRNARCVGQHRKHFLQIELMKAERDILKGLFVLVVGIDLDAHTVGRTQLHVGQHTAVIGEEHVVVVVDAELLIAQHRVHPVGLQADSVFLHRCRQAKGHAKLVVLVVQPCGETGSLFVQCPVEKSVEHIFRIILVVTHLRLVAHIVSIGTNSQVYRVDKNTVNRQSANVQLSVQSANGRRGHVAVHRRHVVAQPAQHLHHKVLPSCCEAYSSVRQAAAQQALVDILFLHLLLQLGCQGIRLPQQPAIASAGIHVEMEVAAIDNGMRGVATGE